MKRYFVIIIGLACMMFSCQEENISLDLADPEIPASTVISDKGDDAFFAYKNREDSLKNRIIAALKYKDEQSSGIVQQSVVSYGQPLWDESESVTIDSAVRILVPMYDSLASDVVGLWCFDNRVNSDTVYYGMLDAAPLALSDTAFAIDLNLLCDYFRFKLGLPTELNIRFEEENNMRPASSADIATPTSNGGITVCVKICGYVGVGDDKEEDYVLKFCTTKCEFYMIYDPDPYDNLPLHDDDGFDGGLGGGGANQEKTYTIIVHATTGGEATGGGEYPDGSSISISAQAIDEDYVFEHWISNGSIVSADLTYTFKVSATQAYMAKFITKDCYNKRKVAENANLNAMLTSLKGNAQKDTNEVAMFETFNYNGNNSTLSGKRNGIAGEAGFPGLNGGTYNWMFHSHPAGQGVIFSGRDLMSLYQIYANHLYTDLSSFLWGIVNHNGGAYALAITNPLLFEQFAQKYRLGGSDPEYIKQKVDYRISSFDVSRAEERFTEFISGSGLSLLKIDDVVSSQNRWEAITYNAEAEKVTEQPCD